MGEQVYEQPFTVVPCAPGEVPPANESGKPLGRHLDGCRIGFDLGASDRKVSAVVDGQAVYSEEVVWEPRKQTDPEYHYREILAAIKTAAAKMPRVDAIGGSSAGIFIDNRPMVASLFRGVPQERFGEIRNLFLRIRDELGVPLEVINDGDVTALAGAMSLEDNGVLGIALGSSEAAGYVDLDGQHHRLAERAGLCAGRLQPGPPRSTNGRATGAWGRSISRSSACSAWRPGAGIEIPAGITDAEKLKFVQEKLEAGHAGRGEDLAEHGLLTWATAWRTTPISTS